MKELYMALEEAVSQQRLDAQHGISQEDCVNEFMKELHYAGYTIVPISALTPPVTPAVTPEVIHREFDIAELKHSYQRLLDKHLKPLLEDALDAVEIEMPSIAARRIKLAIEMIKRFNA